MNCFQWDFCTFFQEKAQALLKKIIQEENEKLQEVLKKLHEPFSFKRKHMPNSHRQLYLHVINFGRKFWSGGRGDLTIKKCMPPFLISILCPYLQIKMEKGAPPLVSDAYASIHVISSYLKNEVHCMDTHSLKLPCVHFNCLLPQIMTMISNEL